MTQPESNILSERWVRPPPQPALGESEVHVWRIELDLPAAHLRALEPALSDAEREKAARFYFEADRARYIAAKTCQRAVLAAYLGVEPGGLVFEANPYGKPYLGGEQQGTELRFNLSHTRGLGVLAAARGADLGVDVERVRGREVDLGLARRFFSTREVAALEGLPAAEQKEAFFTCWTRKEAYIKARGEGLSFPLDKFSVSLAPGAPPALLSNNVDPQEPGRWDIYHLALGPGYAGALVVPAQGWAFKQYRWPVANQGDP